MASYWKTFAMQGVFVYVYVCVCVCVVCVCKCTIHSSSPKPLQPHPSADHASVMLSKNGSHHQSPSIQNPQETWLQFLGNH